MAPKILIVDDDPDVVSALAYLLKVEGYQICKSGSPKEAIDYLAVGNFELVLADLNYTSDTTSGKEGLEFIKTVRDLGYQAQIVAMTAWGNVELAVEAMRMGAGDFIQKPWDDERLLSIIRNQLSLGKALKRTDTLKEKNKLLRQQLDSSDSPLISESDVMQELMGKIHQVAQSDASILLTGENGTGKSMLAERIHLLSLRRGHDLISVNMGSISETLFESEMFGHVKGAFTDAHESRIGRFELADKGTIFLDEIGNTPYSQQAKLLRVLETKQFERAGSSTTQTSDCRVITATNANLNEEVESSRFRRDLLYRINTIQLRVPSLRERRTDIPILVNTFLGKFAKKYDKREIGVSDAAMDAIYRYDWPGNIRELSHLIERAVLLCSSKQISVSDLGILSSSVAGGSGRPGMIAGCELSTSTLEEIESAVIGARLDIYCGNAAEAAKSLGLSKSAIYRRLSKQR